MIDLRSAEGREARDDPRSSVDPATTQVYRPGAVIEAEGETRPVLRRLLHGWAARTRTLADGRRQIVRIFIPGDLCGAPLVRGAAAPCATVALTSARVLVLGPAMEGSDPPANERLLAMMNAAEAEERLGMLHQIVRLGRLSAYERTAHLLLELYHRLERAGLKQGASVPMPLTQESLADALGLSIVHTNRVLQQLRGDGLIVFRASRFSTPDLAALARISGYDPGDHEDALPPRRPSAKRPPAQRTFLEQT
jgi:CRP-like cAMP-binding protein